MFSAKRLFAKLAIAASLAIMSMGSVALAYLTDTSVYVPLN